MNGRRHNMRFARHSGRETRQHQGVRSFTAIDLPLRNGMSGAPVVRHVARKGASTPADTWAFYLALPYRFACGRQPDKRVLLVTLPSYARLCNLNLVSRSTSPRKTICRSRSTIVRARFGPRRARMRPPASISGVRKNRVESYCIVGPAQPTRIPVIGMKSCTYARTPQGPVILATVVARTVCPVEV